MKREEAEAIAKELLEKEGLATHFSKYLICGSIRRKCEEVNDIDIVAIPKAEAMYEFGQPSLSQFVDCQDPNMARGSYTSPARFLNGKAIKRFKYKGIMVDLYLASEQTFQTLVLIRTGSADHNKRLTILARGKGLKLKADGTGLCKVKGGLYNNEPEEVIEIVDNTENGILYKLLGFIPIPERRS